jgi:cytidylate kinase
VLDGRDIGTAVVPGADIKNFVTASPEVRARRRTDELLKKGRQVEFARILAEIRERDARDSGRAVAPLRQAADAYLLDTTDKDIDTAFRAAVDIIEKARAEREKRAHP